MLAYNARVIMQKRDRMELHSLSDDVAHSGWNLESSLTVLN